METLQRTANRGSLATGYDIDNSIKLDGDNSERMQRASNTIGTPTNAKIATLSFWAKRSALKSDNAHFSFIANAGANSTFICFEQDKARVYTTGGNSLTSNALFRDTSAWYHFVAAFDMTQGTASNRVKIYINGVQITSFETETYGTQNNDIGFYDTNMSHYFGYAGSQGWFGYIAEAHFIDGQQLAPTEFGEFDSDTGIWKPKEYDGTYGNEGYYLDMSNASNLGEDQSGNDNDFGALYNITSADQAVDTPTNNFCTLNPLMANAGSANYLTVTEGGTKGVNAAAAYKIANSSIGVSSGKWYWEVKLTAISGVTGMGVTMPNYWDADYTLQGTIILHSGARYNNASRTDNVTNTFSAGDIVGFALDMDATPPTLQVYKNNTSEANLMDGLSINGAGAAFLPEKKDFYFPKIVGYSNNTFECNFGGYTSFSISSAESDANGYGNFEYAPPSGYYAICTKNLAEYG